MAPSQEQQQNGREPVESIAIVGISCRLPGDATSPSKLCESLAQGRSTWSEFPSSRLNAAGFVDSKTTRVGTTNTVGGHFLSQDIAAFDAAFLGINPKEASAIDPQQRLLLESAYEAFEASSMSLSDLWGSKTGVFVGYWASDYHEMLSRDTNNPATYQTTGTGPAISSNRISYTFNLKGPSFTVDTGCSSSMVALHQAVQSLRSGETHASFTGGMNALLDPRRFTYMSRLKMFSDEGRSFPFDDRANGYDRGEGCTGLVLMRLSDAQKERCPIRAVIRNLAINQDGRTFGISVPSKPAQTAAIHTAYAQARLDLQVDYVEAHSTGTRVGDPIKAEAIATAISQHRTADNPLPNGSVKGNVGHLESAAGLVGLIKGVLMLENSAIPPQANFESPNPVIDLNRLNLRVPKTLEKHDLKRISVNCFSYRGINGHVILERAPQQKAIKSQTPVPNSVNGHAPDSYVKGTSYSQAQLFILSASTEGSLHAYCTALSTYLLSKHTLLMLHH